MKKSDYRRFKIQTVMGANDFASMKEVVTRRYGSAEALARPDLILIDGGLGQLAAALDGLREVGAQEIPLIGLAKARGDKAERIFMAGRKNPLVLKGHAPSTHLLQRIRDEAHRFAITYHRKLRGKSLVASQLDHIVGIGEIRRMSLLKTFGTPAQVSQATDEELRAAGLNTAAIAQLRAALT